MKKISLLLVVILFIGSFMIQVSAQEKSYTATFSASGVFTYKEDSENIIFSYIKLSDIEDFSHGEIVFRYNSNVLKGSPEKNSKPLIDKEERFETEYEKGENYTIIHFKKNENAASDFSFSSFTLPFQSLSTGEHGLSINVFAYNEKNEKIEYDVVYEFDLYDKIVEDSSVPTIDTSKVELKNRLFYLESGTTADAVIEKFGDSGLSLFVPTNGILDGDTNIPNGAYITAMYEGFVADKVQICVTEDVNCDAKITAADARLALRTSAKLETLYGVCRYAADVNNDDKITSADARLILRKAAGLE